MNKKRLNDLLDVLNENLERETLVMDFWNESSAVADNLEELEYKNYCGFAGCAIGLFLTSPKSNGLLQELTQQFPRWADIQDFFNLTFEEADYLFYHENYQDEPYDDELTIIPIEKVIERLIDFIQTGKLRRNEYLY